MRAANGGFAVEDKGPAGGQPGAAKGVKKNNLPPHVSRPTPPKPHLPQSPYLKTIRFGILDCQGCTSCAEYTRLALDNRIHAGFFHYGGLGNTAIRAYKTPDLSIFRFGPYSGAQISLLSDDLFLIDINIPPHRGNSEAPG